MQEPDLARRGGASLVVWDEREPCEAARCAGPRPQARAASRTRVGAHQDVVFAIRFELPGVEERETVEVRDHLRHLRGILDDERLLNAAVARLRYRVAARQVIVIHAGGD